MNTESNNSRLDATTVLTGVGGERHCREGTHGITQVQGPLREVNPYVLLVVYCTAWRGSQYKRSLSSSRCITMATTRLAEEEESTGVQLANPLPERAPPPFIGVLVLFPQIFRREGIPHGDEGGVRVHNKVGVHGHGPWQERRHQSWKKPPSNQDGGQALQEFWRGPR